MYTNLIRCIENADCITITKVLRSTSPEVLSLALSAAEKGQKPRVAEILKTYGAI